MNLQSKFYFLRLSLVKSIDALSPLGAQQAEQHAHGADALFLGDGPRPQGRQLADQGRPRPHHQQQVNISLTSES